MDIKVNDKPYAVADGMTVEELLPVIGVAADGIAVAVDGTVVPRIEWNTHRLADGASVVVIKAFYGG